LQGGGGIIGISTGKFLLQHCATTGSALILITTMGVGIVLLADKFIISLIRAIPKTLKQIARRQPRKAKIHIPKRPARPVRPAISDHRPKRVCTKWLKLRLWSTPARPIAKPNRKYAYQLALSPQQRLLLSAMHTWQPFQSRR